jgi:hypothetical protein
MPERDPSRRRYNRIAELVGRASELPVAQRRGFVEAECADAPGLASEALELLGDPGGADLEQPIVLLRADLRPGHVIADRYAITAALGAGAQGRVYEAEDRRLGKRLAIKQMLGHDAVALRLFEREARLLGQLRDGAPGHLAAMLPNATDLVTDADGLYLAMDFVPGVTLAELLERRGEALPLAQVLEWGDRLLELLEFLHTREPEPIVHRDLKPGNLKLAPDGQLVLLDFGLTKGAIARLSRLGRAATSVGALGTPQYAPWEQVRDGTADERSDVFSAGATLYRLLTGARFPDVFARTEALADGRPDPLVPAHRLNPAVPAALAGALQQAMRLKPGDRYASAAEFRSAWRRGGAADEITANAPTSARHERGVLERGLLLLLGVMLAIWCVAEPWCAPLHLAAATLLGLALAAPAGQRGRTALPRIRRVWLAALLVLAGAPMLAPVWRRTGLVLAHHLDLLGERLFGSVWEMLTQRSVALPLLALGVVGLAALYMGGDALRPGRWLAALRRRTNA